MKRLIPILLMVIFSVGVYADTASRTPGGVSTEPVRNGLLWDYPMPDPTVVHTYFDDFDRYKHQDWSITTTEYVTTPSSALSDGDDGILNSTGVNGIGGAQIHWGTAETFTFESGKELWFEAKASVVNVTSCTAVIGLAQKAKYDFTDVQIAAFIKSPTTPTVQFVVRAAGSQTAETSVDTAVEATYATYGFYYNGSDTIKYFIDGVHTGTVVDDNMPTTEVTPVFGIISDVTGSAANQLNVDYIFVAKER